MQFVNSLLLQLLWSPILVNYPPIKNTLVYRDTGRSAYQSVVSSQL